jgi:hypothetical protein
MCLADSVGDYSLSQPVLALVLVQPSHSSLLHRGSSSWRDRTSDMVVSFRWRPSFYGRRG